MHIVDILLKYIVGTITDSAIYEIYISETSFEKYNINVREV